MWSNCLLGNDKEPSLGNDKEPSVVFVYAHEHTTWCSCMRMNGASPEAPGAAAPRHQIIRRPI